jgi:hypothetical protein
LFKLVTPIKEMEMEVTVSMDHHLKMSRFGFLIHIRVSYPPLKMIAMAIWVSSHRIWSIARTSKDTIILNLWLVLHLKQSSTLSIQSLVGSSTAGSSSKKSMRLKLKSSWTSSWRGL